MTLVPICICGQGSVCDGRSNCPNNHYSSIAKGKTIAFNFDDLHLKSIRKLKGLTLKEVEKSTGISNAYISQVENGKIAQPSFKTVKTLLEYYGFSVTITINT